MIKSFTPLFLSFIMMGIMACNNNPSTEKVDAKLNKNTAEISFETLEHDFGKIEYKGDASFDFIFTNKGNEPLVLKNVKPTCGCTASDYTKEPLGKDETGKISIKYRTSITGSFTKSIMVYSNASEPVVKLIIKGTVEKPAAAEG